MAMTHDPIVDEIRRYREEYAANFNHDIKAMVEDAQRRQADDGREVVRLDPRPPQRQATSDG